MSPEKPQSIASLETRIVELEALYMHQQKLIQDLNDVIIDQHRRLDQYEQQAAHLSHRTESLFATLETPRLPEDEKPPHY